MYSSNNGTGIRPWATELAFWIPHALPHWLAAHRPQTSPPLFSYGCKRNNKKSSYDIKSGVDVRAHWLTDTVMKHALLGVGISGSHISLTWSIHVLQSCWMRNWNWFLKDVIKIQAMTSAAPVFRYNYRNVIQTKAGANNSTTENHTSTLCCTSTGNICTWRKFQLFPIYTITSHSASQWVLSCVMINW